MQKILFRSSSLLRRDQRYALPFLCVYVLLAVALHGAQASFDDHAAHLIIESVPDKPEFDCMEAQFSGLVPTKGIHGDAILWGACNLAELSETMLAGWARGAAESLVFIASESCSDQMHRLVDVIASAPKIRAVVVEDWLSGDDASTPAALPSSIKKSSMPSPPVCTITHNAMKRMELIYGKMPPHRHFATVRLNNRQFENLYVLCDQCAVQGVYIDGVPLDVNAEQPTLGVTVSEHYRTVAVTVRAEASGASFVLGLSDGFATGIGNWRCTKPTADASASKAALESWIKTGMVDERSEKPALIRAHTFGPGAMHNNFDGDNNINGADDDNNSDNASSSDSHGGPSYIWPAQGGAALVGEVTTCFASRSSARVSKYGFEYEFVGKRLTFHDAKEFCRNERNGSLVSIHSRAEEALVESIIPWRTETNVWIGLEGLAEKAGYFRWLSGAPVDYTNWNRQHVSGPSSGAVCVHLATVNSLSTSSSSSLMGMNWVRDDCSRRASFVCKRVAPTISDDRVRESEDRCFAYLREDGMILPAAPPQRLVNLQSGLCSYGSQYSCCSAGAIDTEFARAHEFITSQVESPMCAHALEDLACAVCLPSSHHFVSWASNQISMRWCRDTCETIFEACKSEKTFLKNESIEDFAREPCMLLRRHIYESASNSPRFDIAIIDGHSEECLRIDSRPPTITRAILPGSTMDGAEASVDLVRLFFDEQIEIRSGEVLVSSAETHKVVRVIPLDSATLSRTRFPNDTITLRINKATELVAGAYDLNVPNFAIFDMAGNMFTGTNTFTSPLRFSAAASPGVDIVEPLPIKPDPVPIPIPDPMEPLPDPPMEPWVPDEPSPSPSAKSGGLGAFFVIVIVCGVLGGLFVVARKSWRRGPGSSSSAPFYDRLGDTFSDLTTSLSGRLARAESSFAPSAYSAHDHSAAHASLETELSSSAVASRAPSESSSVGLLDAEVGPP